MLSRDCNVFLAFITCFIMRQAAPTTGGLRIVAVLLRHVAAQRDDVHYSTSPSWSVRRQRGWHATGVVHMECTRAASGLPRCRTATAGGPRLGCSSSSKADYHTAWGVSTAKSGCRTMLPELAFTGRQLHVTANMNDRLEGCWVSSIVAVTAHMLAHFHPHILSARPARPSNST